MDWCRAEFPIRKAESQLHSAFPPDEGDASALPPTSFQATFFGDTWNSYPKPHDPIPYGQYTRVSPSHQLLPRVLVTCMGRVSRPVDLGPGPSRMLLLSSKRSEAPLRLSPAEGTTPGHKPPEAFCHLPELLRAREA